jgi:hypothetical protein
MNEQGNDVTPAFIQYATPLIGGPLPRTGKLENIPA